MVGRCHPVLHQGGEINHLHDHIVILGHVVPDGLALANGSFDEQCVRRPRAVRPVTDALEGECDPGWVVVASVATVFGALVDGGIGQGSTEALIK